MKWFCLSGMIGICFSVSLYGVDVDAHSSRSCDTYRYKTHDLLTPDNLEELEQHIQNLVYATKDYSRELVRLYSSLSFMVKKAGVALKYDQLYLSAIEQALILKHAKERN